MLPKEDRKTISVMICDLLMIKKDFSIVESSACSELYALLTTGFHQRTIQGYRSMRSDFHKNKGEFTESKQGKYSRITLT